MGFALLSFVFCIGWQYVAGRVITVSEYEYVREADVFMRLHIVPANWSDASTICQLEGSVLASPSNSALTNAMKASMERYKLIYDDVFIGATSRFSKGDFKSLDGLGLANDLEWASGEPDNERDAENCLVLTREGKLADISCARVRPFFCRKLLHTCAFHDLAKEFRIDYVGEPVVIPERCNDGYKWVQSASGCYKFHGDAKSWRNALSTCHAEGGHLAIINSRTESTVLGSIYDEFAKNITGADEDRHAFIGFRKFEDGEWATIYGETLAEAGFEVWDLKEPSNGAGYKKTPKEDCGSIHRNGLLNDAPCVQICPFICERAPNYL